jgi:hypothetical protein
MSKGGLPSGRVDSPELRAKWVAFKGGPKGRGDRHERRQGITLIADYHAQDIEFRWFNQAAGEERTGKYCGGFFQVVRLWWPALRSPSASRRPPPVPAGNSTVNNWEQPFWALCSGIFVRIRLLMVRGNSAPLARFLSPARLFRVTGADRAHGTIAGSGGRATDQAADGSIQTAGYARRSGPLSTAAA